MTRSRIELKTPEGDFVLTMLSAAGTILESADLAGITLPSQCRAGVCSTCAARLISGTVEMDSNSALDDEQVEAGWILLCQARPTSESVSISVGIDSL